MRLMCSMCSMCSIGSLLLAVGVSSLGVADRAEAQALSLETVATGLARPLLVTHAPNDFDRIFIVEQRSGSTGRVRILDTATGNILPTPFLSQSGVSTGSEQGLLGFVFHPEYETNGYVYINYTLPNRSTQIRRYTRDANNPNIVDPSSAVNILNIAQPFTNHNGGWMEFGPFDGLLYISVGDGGSANDPGNRAQDITNQLLGKMLRIDVDGDDFPSDSNRNYAIPADNPFVGISGDDEIWAFGLRNAWRSNFDQVTGDLYIADVGQNAREEINFVPFGSAGGMNFGWRCMEGDVCTGLSGCSCTAGNLEMPIQVYENTGFFGDCSITGGQVYRGCAMPELNGTYFYADYCSDKVWKLRYDGAVVTENVRVDQELESNSGITLNNIVSFGRDAFGEMYICSQNGVVYKIVPDAGIDDCNNNSIDDACEVAFGLAEDCDGGLLGDPIMGAAVFATNCASCHAEDGTGQFGPDIRGKGRMRLAEFAGGSTFHPGGQFTELGAAEFAHIESFLSDSGSQARPDGIPDECQTLDDCNMNGRADGCDLADGTAFDMDFNGVLDICQACSPSDITTDGTANGIPDGQVTLSDFSFYLSLWSGSASQADLTTDGTANGIPDGQVTLSDFSFYLSLWSAGCP